jgi:NAD-dependent deacetylase
MHAVFLAGSTLGSFAGALAALTGAAIWTVWILSELDQTVPPLLLPFIAGTWISIVLLRYLSRSRLFQPSLWRAAEALTEARAKGGTTTVLIGAGANPSRDTPVRSGRSWSRAKSIRESCTMDDFKSTAYNRRAFWDACSQLRENAKTAEMDEVYSTLASMADKGWLKTVMTLSVDGRQRAAGLHDLIELQGQLDRVHCIDCNQSSDWPPKAIWQRYDIQCPSCSGLMKPAVSLSGEEVPLEIWQCANSAVRDCQVLMLIGIESTAASTMRLLEQARATGSIVVIVENDPPPIVVQAEDVLLYGAMRQDLAALAQILRYPRFVQFISRQVLTPLNQILVRRAKKNARRCTSNP